MQVAHSWSVVLAILGCDENEDKGKEVEKNPETNNKVLEELPRDYLALEAFSSFVASFLFLRGYTLDYDRTNRLAVFTHYGSVPLGLIFLALSFFFFIAAYTGRLYGIGKRARKFLLFPSGIISLTVIVQTWLDGIKALMPGSIWFYIFFFGGLIFFLLFAFHLLWSTAKYSEIYKPKPKVADKNKETNQT